jgi:hypothetical protein
MVVILLLTLGCLLLHFTCWFWENPGFKFICGSSFKVSTKFYYKVLNFFIFIFNDLCYLKYSLLRIRLFLTKPLGFIQDDRILDENPCLKLLFSKASDRAVEIEVDMVVANVGNVELENIEHLMLHFMMTGFMIYLLLKI